MLLISGAPGRCRVDLASLVWLLSMGRAVRPIVAMVLLSTAASAYAGAFDRNTDGRGTAAASPEPQSFAVYALSRGKGVPEGARAVLARAEGVLKELREQGADIAITKERIGLEGETRLCATFADRRLAEEALERIRRLASGVDLVNLRKESCGAAAKP